LRARSLSFQSKHSASQALESVYYLLENNGQARLSLLACPAVELLRVRPPVRDLIPDCVAAGFVLSQETAFPYNEPSISAVLIEIRVSQVENRDLSSKLWSLLNALMNAS
jgi:hypothetical protein